MKELTEVPESKAAAGQGIVAEFAGEVLEQIRRHARSSMSAEICGVLIGTASEGKTQVSACIAGEGAEQGGAHVTFTQDTWEHIFKIKDARYPSESIVGWYHSHPGFGIFLSDYDLFIHENFFSGPHQLAWVFDPHSDAEGCFAWVDKKVQPLRQFTVVGDHQAPAAEQLAREEASRKALDSAPAPEKKAASTAKVRPRSRWRSLPAMMGCGLLGLVAGAAFPRFFPEDSRAMWALVDRYFGASRPQPAASPVPGTAPQVTR